ncbi:SRPBCC domain-containing protein [Bdellovibrio sp. ZAP7]|uniref:SRPBCC family protein n=1 Tax=Bdellovibrio sp. ZAP7 TaxID=2231053 RepID=UPI00115A0A42|nr:SRPBCC domain-containing protein [Bdellovibrio sp. ZAP7]QDK47074.1 SRPBCC domain-containing protein [Bdellovibrio sp. ZAP7]
MSTKKNLTITMTFDESPKKVFDAVANVRGWWSEDLKGTSNKLGGKFNYKFKDIHTSTQRVTEFIPNKKIVWKVLDSNLSFLKQKDEWTGTEVIFEISKKGDKTQLRFTHVGLTPDVECYDACFDGWGYFVKKSLKSLIKTGEGKPNPK